MTLSSFITTWLLNQGVENPEVFSTWLQSMREHQFDRDELLIRAGDPATRLFIIRDGLVRQYYTTPEGKERNKAFMTNNQVTGPVSAAIHDSTAPFSIQALEPVAAISADFESLKQLVAVEPAVAKLYIRLLSDAFIRNEQREAMLLTRNAQQRLQWLQEHEPELLQRVPQFHIATYIGVEAVSLSRLKRKSIDE